MDEDLDIGSRRIREAVDLWTSRVEAAKKAGDMALMKKALRHQTRYETELAEHRKLIKNIPNVRDKRLESPCIGCWLENECELPGWMNKGSLFDALLFSTALDSGLNWNTMTQMLGFKDSDFPHFDPFEDEELCDDHRDNVTRFTLMSIRLEKQLVARINQRHLLSEKCYIQMQVCRKHRFLAACPKIEQPSAHSPTEQ